MSSKIYRIAILGPPFSGKTQFCHFVNKDLSYMKEYSSPQIPISYKIKRCDINLELIDPPPGFHDLEEIILEKMINYLKEKKEIDHILLILRYEQRLTNSDKNYFNLLAKTFTSSEFFHHLSIIFTNFPIHPKKRDINMKQTYIAQINSILRNSFNLEKEQSIPEVPVYFIDTEIIEEDDGKMHFTEKYQDTVDIIIERIKLFCDIYKPINTENLNITGYNVQKRIEKEKQKIYEYERKRIEEEQKKLEEEKKIEEGKKRKMLLIGGIATLLSFTTFGPFLIGGGLLYRKKLFG